MFLHVGGFWLMLLILLLAAAVRFHLLGAQSFWNDEGNAYVQATRSFTEIADHAARDIHPPGYYWLLALWRGLAGDTEFALRALSALFSIVSVAFTYALGRRLYAPGAGIIAAGLVALNTFSIYYAQEARMYSLLALWAVASMWVLVGFVRCPGWRWGLALALVNAAGMWTQYAFAFVMLAQGALVVLWLAAEWRARGVKPFAYTFGVYVAANLLTFALYIPWLPTAFTQITTWPSTGEPVPFAVALGTILNWLAYGMTYGYTNAGALAIANFLLLFGVMTLHRRPRAWWALLVPVVWVVAALAIFFAFSLFRPSNLKLLLPAQIALALWLARGLWMLWHYAANERRRGIANRHRARAAIFRLAAVVGGAWLVFNLLAGLAPLHTDPAYRRADYRAIVQTITADLRELDAIILDAPNQEEVFRYYYRGDAPIYSLPAGLGGSDEATRAAVQNILAAHDRAFVVFWGETERDPNRVVETSLDAGAFEVGDTWYGDVRLARYVMPADLPDVTETNVRFGDDITLVGYALSADTLTPGDVLQVRLDWQTDAPLDTRYKVFVQLLDENGQLVAQRDSEPGGGLALTTTWNPDETVHDNHGLLVPADLPPAHYLLIVGLYDLNDAAARLSVDDSDHFTLGRMTLQPPRGDSQ